MKTFNLTEEQVDLLCEELVEANNAERYYLDDPHTDIDDDERAYMEVRITERNELIDLLRT